MGANPMRLGTVQSVQTDVLRAKRNGTAGNVSTDAKTLKLGSTANVSTVAHMVNPGTQNPKSVSAYAKTLRIISRENVFQNVNQMRSGMPNLKNVQKFVKKAQHTPMVPARTTANKARLGKMVSVLGIAKTGRSGIQ